MMHSKSTLLAAFWVLLSTECNGFSTFSSRQPKQSSARSLRAQDEEAVSYEITAFDRRAFLGTALVASSLFVTSPANARDGLFRPNPLTNGVLEQIRIWEQDEADNLKYGGELEAGDVGNKGKVSAYPKLLIPILKIDRELAEVKTLVHDEDRSKAWPKALAILQKQEYEKIQFKRVFNAYADNIYYSDPDRSNVYLGGGATPKTEQSLAYLLRNDVLTNVENLSAELEYLLKTGDDDLKDLYAYADIVTSAMKKYLVLVPPNELEEANKLLASS